MDSKTRTKEWKSQSLLIRGVILRERVVLFMEYSYSRSLNPFNQGVILTNKQAVKAAIARINVSILLIRGVPLPIHTHRRYYA